MKFENDYSIAYGRKRSDSWKSIETIVITLLTILLAHVASPEDPYSLSGPFPWVLLAPVFCSLFYSNLYGAISLLILLVILLYEQSTDLFDSLQLREYLAGSIGLTLLVGIFSSYWNSRIQHVEDLNEYVREHLENLSRDYFLLRISHERIEQSYIVKPLSLRDAFIQIKQELLKNKCEINPASGEALLLIFSQFCSINSAAFCLYNHNSKEIDTLAVLGKHFFISNSDPLIENIINQKTAAYFAVNKLAARNSDYLAAVPLLNTDSELIGFIIIKDMPFWSLTHDNLETLCVFASYFTAILTTLEGPGPLIEEFPSCPPEFLNELKAVVSLNKEYRVDSFLACIVVPPSEQQQNIIHILVRQKRSLDYLWQLDLGSAKLVITLMPLTGMEAMLGYRNRINSLLKNDFGLEINTQGLNFRFQQINDQAVNTQLDTFVENATHAIE